MESLYRMSSRDSNLLIDKEFDEKYCFVYVECPSCNCGLAYIVWLEDYSSGYCPDCRIEWIEK